MECLASLDDGMRRAERLEAPEAFGRLALTDDLRVALNGRCWVALMTEDDVEL